MRLSRRHSVVLEESKVCDEQRLISWACPVSSAMRSRGIHVDCTSRRDIHIDLFLELAKHRTVLLLEVSRYIYGINAISTKSKTGNLSRRQHSRIVPRSCLVSMGEGFRGSKPGRGKRINLLETVHSGSGANTTVPEFIFRVKRPCKDISSSLPGPEAYASDAPQPAGLLCNPESPLILDVPASAARSTRRERP
jgi:hypothetical protein